MDIKIAIAYHIESFTLKQKHLIPVHAGKAVSNKELGIQSDAEGENISKKNPWYCELTVLYWLWKNTKADYKGLMHYRRCFTRNNTFFLQRAFLHVKYTFRRFSSIWSPYSSLGVKKQYSCSNEKEFRQSVEKFTNKLEDILADGTRVIAPHPGHFYINIKTFLAYQVGIQNITLLDNIIQSEYQDFYPYWRTACESHYLYNANMVVMSNDIFEDYCTKLFGILKRHEEEVINQGYLIDITNEKAFSRISGYLGEMITNAYIYYCKDKGIKMKVLPVAFLEGEDSDNVYRQTDGSSIIRSRLRKIYYSLFNGIHKNFKITYLINGFAMLATPKFLFRMQRNNILNSYLKLPKEEKNIIDERVNYYCHMLHNDELREVAATKETKRPIKVKYLNNHRYHNKEGNTVYFFDTFEFTRYFPQNLRWLHKPGDVSYRIPAPTVVKSRLIPREDEHCNEVILNLDKVRHFCFIKDPFCWEDKVGMVIFRGACYQKPEREKFLKMFINHPRFDVKDTSKDSVNPIEWRQKKELSLYDHLKYRYIMSLEGNDVASNLKWVMSSNSCAVMPRPRCETWFMEGKLIPNYHYIEVKADFSDLIERINYYEYHPDEAKAIVRHAHEWCQQFHNEKREKLISVMVLQKYFEKTGQL